MTSFTIEGRALASALKRAVTENSIPILSCVRLAVLHGQLFVTSTNLDMTAVTNLDIIDGEDMDICLPFDRLSKIAKTAGAAPVKVFADGGVDVAAGDALYQLETLPASDWPEMKSKPAGQTQSFEGGLSKWLSIVAHSISTEETRYYLNGVAWQRNEHGNMFVTTDGHRLTAVDNGLGSDGDPISVIIPKGAVAWLVAHSKTNTDVVIRGVEASFVCGNTVLTAKLIDGPDWRRVVPSLEGDPFLSVTVKRERLMEAVVRVCIDNEYMAVKLHGIDGQLWVERKKAKAKAFADWPTNGADKHIGFNATYLRSTLIGNGPMRIVQMQSGGPTYFIDDAAPHITRIVMPMRFA